MTEVDYDRLNAEAAKLYDYAYAAGRSAGVDEENSSLARKAATDALEMADLVAATALGMLPPEHYERLGKLAAMILYRTCPVVYSQHLDQIRRELGRGRLDAARELIRRDLDALKGAIV